MYKRIVSLAPSNTEILYALNAEDNLVAVTRYCDFPDDARKKPIGMLCLMIKFTF